MEHKLEMLLRFEKYRQYYHMCSLWASVFEGRNMEWIYCPESDRGNGIWQGADFYFPEQDTYFVVDQRRPGGGKGRIGCRSMSKKTGKMIVMGESQGKSVSYTHLDVYKRQVYALVHALCSIYNG